MRLSYLLALAVLACPLSANVTLPYILADHMVVQRGLPVHVWGKAAPGENVSVAFRGHTRVATADATGRWSLYLPPGEAGGPFDLTVTGANTITLRDVLVGDVWIAAGQSNMEWPVAWAAKPEAEAAAANYPRIRLVRTMHKVSHYPVDNLVGQMWAPCSPETVQKFSAAGYHFGRELHERLGVPIGLIQTAWGGTPIEAWTRLGALASEPTLMPVFAEWAAMSEKFAAALAPFTRPGKDAALRKDAPGSHWMPGGLYNAMVAPLTAYPIRGVIWYQGESNTSTSRAPHYARLLQTLIRDWRRAWAQGDFPFLLVQLANYKSPEDLWPEVREAQRQALALANTGMAVTIDIGEPDNIHPGNKREVGRRLALAARALVYGEKIEHSGPVFRRAAREGAALRLWFDHAAGLRAKGGRLKGFEIAGAEGKYVPAQAVIDGETVVVRCPSVAAPLRVRYAWADHPECNLYNAAGLPAGPFRWEP